MENIFKGCMPALMTPCNQDLSPNFEVGGNRGKKKRRRKD